MWLHDPPQITNQLTQGSPHSPFLHNKGVGSRLPLLPLLDHVTPLLGLCTYTCTMEREVGRHHVGWASIRNTRYFVNFSIYDAISSVFKNPFVC